MPKHRDQGPLRRDLEIQDEDDALEQSAVDLAGLTLAEETDHGVDPYNSARHYVADRFRKG